MILAAIQAAETAAQGTNVELIGIAVVALFFMVLLVKLALAKDPDEQGKADTSVD